MAADAEAPLVIRVAANLDQLRANLLEGVNQIETTSTAMRQMATAYDGSRAISQAGAVMAAIQAVGGVTHLTADEQAKANAVLDAAIQKYAALGQTAPPGMQALAEATRKVATETEAAAGPTGTLASVIDQIAGKFGLSTGSITQFLGPLGEISAVAAGAVIAIAAVGYEVFSLAEAATASGDHIQDMALKMGIGAVQADQLNFAVTVAGGNIEQLSNAVFMMARRLEEAGPAGDKARAALTGVGIDAKAFMALSLDQQILAVSDAFRQTVPNALQVNDLFGRQGKEILPQLLKPMADLVEQYKALHGRTNEQIQDAADLALEERKLHEEWSKLWTDLGTVFSPVMKLVDAGMQVLIDDWRKATSDLTANKDAILLAAQALGILHSEMAKAPPVAGAAKAGMEAYLKSLQSGAATLPDLGNNFKNVKEIIAELTRQLTENNTAQKEADRLDAEVTRGLKAYADAVNELNSVAKVANFLGETWRETIKGISAETVTAAKAYLAEGASLQAVALEYGLTKAQVDALSSAVKEEQGIAKEATDQSIDAAQARLDKERAVFQFMEENAGHYTNATLQAQRDKIQELTDAMHTYGDASVADLDRIAAATKKLQDQEAARQQKLEEDAAKNRAMGSSTTYDLSTQAGRDAVPPEIATWLHAGYSLAQATAIAFDLAWRIPINQNDPLFAHKGPAVPGFIGGVADAPGGWAMVGEGGPETMYVPPHASIFPTGSGPGGGSTNYITINVTQPLGTPTAIAMAVDAALTARQRQIGTRLT